MDEPAAFGRLRFGVFELDRRSGELRMAGTRLRLQEGPLGVLQALLDRPGEIVTREELRHRLWPDGTFVDFDNGLNSAVNRLRASLGDSAEKPQFVETVGRRGYRFIAALTEPEAVTADARPAPLAGAIRTRLAVLPFRQLKADPDTEFLVFSLADAIGSSLSGLESLAVRSTLAAARFAADAPDLNAIATTLDVTLVLAGTILRVGDRVRVATQLVEAPRGTLLWTATAEAALDDLFRVSEGLVRRIVESLSLPLAVHDERRLGRETPGSGRAFELYLRANGLGQYPDTWPQARDLYLETIRIDPHYAPAWARLGRVYRMMAKYAAAEDPQLPRLAEESLRRALALNPEMSLAHYLYAQLEMETGRSFEALVRLLDRARERRADPQLFAGLVQACRYVGLLDASRAAHDRARQLDRSMRTSIGYTWMMTGDYARAVVESRDNDDPLEWLALAFVGPNAESRRALEALRDRYHTNRTWTTYIDMVLAMARGDRSGVVAGAEACLRLPFADPEGWFHVCLMLARAGETVGAIEALRRTVDAGFACPAALNGDPALRALHEQPEFEALRMEMERRHEEARRAFDRAGGQELFT